MLIGHSPYNEYARSLPDNSDVLSNIFNTASVAYLWSGVYKPEGE